MAGEVIELSFANAQALRVLDDLERRLGDVGRKGGAELGRNLAQAVGGGGPGGGGGAGAFGGLAQAVAGGAVAGISAVSPSTATPAHLAARAGFGAAGGALQAGAGVLGAALGGPVGAVAGQAVAALGSLALDRLQEGVFRPLDATQQRVGAVFGQLAAAGVAFNERDAQLAVERVQAQEQRRLVAERRVASLVYSSGSILDSLSFAASAWR